MFRNIIIFYIMLSTMSDKIWAEQNVKAPAIVFIIPYRNRIQHKFFFSNYMPSIMKDYEDNYEIY